MNHASRANRAPLALPLASPLGLPLALAPAGEADDNARRRAGFDRDAPEREELPYKVELWDATRSSVEQILAVTANGSIGYAAYFAATREYPERYITLRHKNSIVSRWNAPSH